MTDVTPRWKNGPKRRTTAKDRQLRKARAEVVRRSQGRCEASVEGVCAVQGSQVHHKRRRSQGGKDTPDNLLLVCHRCHQWIHDHPSTAVELGLLARTSFTEAPGLLNITKADK